jgi:oligopeptide transport system ATP-binding protein
MRDALVIRGLDVRFAVPGGEVRAVSNVDLDIRPAECLGVVGESGCGKSQMFLALLRLLAVNGRASGSVRFGDVDLLTGTTQELNQVRGSRIGMVFQDPMSSLTPHHRAGDQVAEVLEFHRGLDSAAAQARARQLFERVRIGDASRRLRQYPHELSGGMRQRVMLAIALACEPQVLIADEPTSALDVTVQADIVDLLREVHRESGTAIVLISHDLGVVAEIAERTIVMYAGRIVEDAATGKLLSSPRHRYSAALLRAIPRLSAVVSPELVTIPGQPPDLSIAIEGCAFAQRCSAASDECARVVPPLSRDASGRLFACHHPVEMP